MTAPGQYVIPAADYLADAGSDVPTLNSSIARILLSESPRHAWERSPRLNPNYQPEEKEAFDLGRSAHAYILESDETAFAIVDAKDWTTKDAKAARALARTSGQIPLLTSQYERTKAMAEAVTRQLADFAPPVPFTNGLPEQTLVWQEGDVWMRARLDWLTHDRLAIFDLKTVGGSANPDTWARTLFSSGYDVQCAFYARGVKALFAHEPAFYFVVAEQQAPFAVSVVELSPDALDLGARKVDRAVEIWRACLASGQWPAYRREPVTVDAPPWEYTRFDASEGLYEQAERIGRGGAQ